MPIRPAEPPVGAFDVVHRTLSRRAAAATFKLATLAAADPGRLALALPHRIAFPDPADLRQGVVRGRDQADRWRFLILDGSKAVAAATAVRAGTEHFEFGGLNEGPLVRGTEQAVTQAENLDQVRDGEFEAALLVVPRSYVVALWLRNLSSRPGEGRLGEADLLIAIPPSNPVLRPGEAMAPGQFFEALRRAR